MKQVLVAVILIVSTAVITSLYCNRDGVSEGVYSDLISASTPEEMASAFEGLRKVKRYAGTVPKDVGRF